MDSEQDIDIEHPLDYEQIALYIWTATRGIDQGDVSITTSKIAEILRENFPISPMPQYVNAAMVRAAKDELGKNVFPWGRTVLMALRAALAVAPEHHQETKDVEVSTPHNTPMVLPDTRLVRFGICGRLWNRLTKATTPISSSIQDGLLKVQEQKQRGLESGPKANQMKTPTEFDDMESVNSARYLALRVMTTSERLLFTSITNDSEMDAALDKYISDRII